MSRRPNRFLTTLFAALLNQLGDQPCPAGLMTGPDARAVVAMKIFVKGHKVAPVGVSLKSLFRSKNRPSTIGILQKDS